MKIFLRYVIIFLIILINIPIQAQNHWTGITGSAWSSYQIPLTSSSTSKPTGWPNCGNFPNWGTPIAGWLNPSGQYNSQRLLFPPSSRPTSQNQFIWSNSTASPSKTFYKMNLVMPPNSCKKVKIYAVSDEARKIYVNGQQVADVPYNSTSFPWAILTEVDITPYLDCGNNCITAEVTNTSLYCNFVANVQITNTDINFYGTASYNTNVTCDGILSLTGPSTDYPNKTSYSWTGPNGFVSNLKNPLVTTNTRNIHKGTYTVWVKVACCFKTYTVDVDFQSSEVTCINGPDTICENDIDFSCFNIPTNCLTWKGTSNRWSWGLKKLDVAGNVINWPIYGISPQSNFSNSDRTKCLKDLLQAMNLNQNQLVGKYELYFYLDDPCGYSFFTKDIEIVESITDTLPELNLDLCSYCTSIIYKPTKCQNNTTPEIYRINGTNDYTKLTRNSFGQVTLSEGNYIEVCRIDSCHQKIRKINVNKVNETWITEPSVEIKICPDSTYKLMKSFLFEDYCGQVLNRFKVFPQFSLTPISGIEYSDYLHGYFKKTYNLQPGTYSVQEPIANSCNVKVYSLIITAYPRRFPVSYSVTLPCDSNCIKIGEDINATAVGDIGQPFSAVWDDGYIGMERTVCPSSLPKLYTVTYTNRWGCQSENQFMVERDPCCFDPCFELPDTICEGASIIPDIDCFEGGTTSYEWGVHGIFSPGGGYLYHTGRLNGNINSIDLANFENFIGGNTYTIDLQAWGPCGNGPKVFHKTIYIDSSCCERNGKDNQIVDFNMQSFHPLSVGDLYPLGDGPCGDTSYLQKVTNISTGVIFNPPFSTFLFLSTFPTNTYVFDYGCCKDTIHFVYTLPPDPNQGSNVVNGNSSIKLNKKLFIYPNPSNGSKVILSLEKGDELGTVKVYTISGQIIYQNIWKEGDQHSIEVSEWKKGIYLVHVETEEGEIQPKKLIIQ